MSDSSERAGFGLQRFHGYSALAFAAILLVGGLARVAADPSFGIVVASCAPAMASLGVMMLDAATANEAAARTPGIRPDPDRRKGAVMAAASAGSVLSGIGAGIAIAVGAGAVGWIVAGFAVLVLAASVALPTLVRTRVAPVTDPADATRPFLRRRRQFGRPRAAAAFGAAIAVFGAVVMALDVAVLHSSDVRLWVSGPVLVAGGILFVFLAVRQLRAR